MARGWQCPIGHSGSGTLPLPACPACGLPAVTTNLPDEPEVAVPVPVFAELSPKDLAFAGAPTEVAALKWLVQVPVPQSVEDVIAPPFAPPVELVRTHGEPPIEVPEERVEEEPAVEEPFEEEVPIPSPPIVVEAQELLPENEPPADTVPVALAETVVPEPPPPVEVEVEEPLPEVPEEPVAEDLPIPPPPLPRDPEPSEAESAPLIEEAVALPIEPPPLAVEEPIALDLPIPAPPPPSQAWEDEDLAPEDVAPEDVAPDEPREEDSLAPPPVSYPALPAIPATPWWAQYRSAVSLAVVVPVLVAIVSSAVAMALYRKATRLEQSYHEVQEQTEALAQRERDLQATAAQQEAAMAQLRVREKQLEAEQLESRQSQHVLRAAVANATLSDRESQQTFLGLLAGVDDVLQLARKAPRSPDRQKMLASAVSLCQRFTALPGDQPIARLRVARAHRLIGELEALAGNAEVAIKNFEQAISIYEALVARGQEARLSGVDYESELVETHLLLCGLLEGVDPARGDKILAQLEARLAQLDAERRGQPAYRRLAGLCHRQRAVALQLRDQPEEARHEYESAIRELRPLAQEPKSQTELARLHVQRAQMLLAGRDRLLKSGGLAVPPSLYLKQARADGEQALALLKPLDAGDVAPLLGQAYGDLGSALALSKENDRAREKFDDAIKLFTRLVQEAPSNVEYRRLLAVAQGNLGVHLSRTERREQGRKLIATARQALQKLSPSAPLDQARLTMAEGLTLIGLGEMPLAEAPLEEALRLLQGAAKESRTDVRQLLQLAIRNLTSYHERIIRGADERRRGRTLAAHVGQLARLRQLQEQSLPAERSGELGKLREEQAATLRSLANVLELRSDHEGAARCVMEMRPLLAADWSGWLDSAALLSRCLLLARDDVGLAVLEQQRLCRQYGQLALEILKPLERTEEWGKRLEGRDFEALRRMFREEVRRLVDGPAK